MPSERAAYHHGCLVDDINLLREHGGNSDVTLEGGNKKWELHSLILGARSEYFAAAFFNNKFSEGREGRIKLCEDDPDAVDAMVLYIYSGEYEDTMHARFMEDNPPDSPQAVPTAKPTMRSPQHPLNHGVRRDSKLALLPLHAHAVIVGDKYMISEMASLAEHYFAEAVRENWPCVTTGYFQEAARIIYNMPEAITAELREFIAISIARDAESFDQKGGMEELLKECPELAAEVLVKFRDDLRTRQGRRHFLSNSQNPA